MALAIDASTPAMVASAGSVATVVTASFTPPDGALLVVSYQNASGAVAMVKPTNSAGTVAWDAAVKASVTTDGTAAIWLGSVTTGAAMTVTGHIGSAGVLWGIGVTVVTGQAATQNGAIKTAAAGSGAITATTPALVGSNSLIIGTVDNFSTATGPTIPASQSDVFNGNTFLWTNTVDGAGAGWTQYLTGMNIAAGSTATINDTAPTTDAWSLAIVEVLAATAPASTPFIPHRMPLGV